MIFDASHDFIYDRWISTLSVFWEHLMYIWSIYFYLTIYFFGALTISCAHQKLFIFLSPLEFCINIIFFTAKLVFATVNLRFIFFIGLHELSYSCKITYILYIHENKQKLYGTYIVILCKIVKHLLDNRRIIIANWMLIVLCFSVKCDKCEILCSLKLKSLL